MLWLNWFETSRQHVLTAQNSNQKHTHTHKKRYVLQEKPQQHGVAAWGRVPREASTSHGERWAVSQTRRGRRKKTRWEERGRNVDPVSCSMTETHTCVKTAFLFACGCVVESDIFRCLFYFNTTSLLKWYLLGITGRFKAVKLGHKSIEWA